MEIKLIKDKYFILFLFWSSFIISIILIDVFTNIKDIYINIIGFLGLIISLFILAVIIK